MADDSRPDLTEHELEERLAYDGRWLKVRHDTVRLPDGNTAQREYVQHPGAVIIIPVIDEQTVLLEYQYRYALRGHFYEFPAGKMEPGEDPLATAKRELIEECGYEADDWRHLATLHPAIGYSDERVELFAARKLRFVGQALDEGEFLQTLPVKLETLKEWIREGRVTDIKLLIGYAWLTVLGG